MRAVLHLSLHTIKWLFALLLGLIVIVPLCFYLFFDPNDFRPQISTFLSSQTGLPLTIEGKMEFSITPWLGLRVEDITLAQAPDFKGETFIRIKEMDLKIPLHDLLQKRLVIESFMIKGLVLNLEKAADGQSNWDAYAKKFEQKPKTTGSKTTDSKTPAPSSPSSAANKSSFSFKHFDIKDAKVTYIDNKEKQTWALQHVSLSGDAATQSMPIDAQFEVSLTPFKQNATLLAKGSLKGTVAFKKTQRMIDLKTHVSLTMPNTPWKETTLTADLSGDLNTQLKFQAIDLQCGSTHATGNAVFPFDAAKAITFSLAFDNVNLNQFEKTPAQKPQAAASGTSANNASPASLPPSQGSKGRLLEGELSINSLQFKEYTFSKVSASLRKEGSVVTLKPLIATLFGAKLTANISHNLDSPAASTSIQGRISDLAVKPLLQMLKKPEKVSGTANIDFDLTQQSTALNGVVKCEVLNGAVEGIDIMYYLDLAQSLLKKQAVTATDSHHTPFNSLKATLLLHDNLIDNNDLTILGNDYKANAEGSINLNNQTLEYKLKAFKIYQDGKEHTNAYPLAIRIKGPIQNPKIEPDLDVYMKTLINTHFDTKTDALVKKGLNKILDKDDDLEDKIGKEVSKGLKKIFKLLP